MADNESNARFEELRQRWEQEPSSRIFTQLAEEYRRRGEPLEAVKVLEEGLKHHPASVAAQVSLGRCRMEAGLLEPALAALEAVVRKDPTQMVAYRLLVEAYLQQGDAEGASERLEIYSQLNPQDPEIEVLEERCRRLAIATPSPLLSSEEAEREAELSWASPGLPVESSPPPSTASPSSAAAPAGAATGSDPRPMSSTAEAPRSSASSLLSLSPSPHPAPNLFALVPRPLRQWQDALLLEEPVGIAPMPSPAADWPVPAESGGPWLDLPGQSETADVPSEAMVPSPAPADRPSGAAGFFATSPGGEPVGPASAEPDLFEIDDQDGLGAFEAILPAPSTPTAEAEPGPVFSDTELMAEEPEPSLPPQLPVPPVAPPAVDSLAEHLGAATARLDVSEARRDVPEVDRGAPAAKSQPLEVEQAHVDVADDDTVTLAELYRRQGHTRDAEQIFRRVLDTDPDNSVARSGLDAISAQRRGPVDISSLLGDDRSSEAGISEKKAAVLRNYLELLSDGSRDDVP